MSGSMWTALGSLISGSLAFVLEFALLLVALTIVRKRRADAGALIAAAAGIQMLATVLTPLMYLGIARLHSGAGYLETSVIIQLGFSVLRSVGAVLLILGVVRLAADPKDSSSPG